MRVINIIKKDFKNLKDDKILGMIFLLHLILALCHFSHSCISDLKYHGDLRTFGCLLVAVLIFFLGRIGLAFGFTIYACALIYVNTFYNYCSIFLLLIAVGAFPKITKPAILIYLINVSVSFSLQLLLPFSFVIHIVYIILFYLCKTYVYKVNASVKLSLTNDEKEILNELLNGKMQKEIELFSPQTITAKLKNARERNMCESTSELITIYALEGGIKIGKCGKPCKTNCPKKDTCCFIEP